MNDQDKLADDCFELSEAAEEIRAKLSPLVVMRCSVCGEEPPKVKLDVVRMVIHAEGGKPEPRLVCRACAVAGLTA